MKNKKGNVAVIALIVVIVAITAGVTGYLFAKKSQAPAQQVSIAKPITPVTQTRLVAQQPVTTPETQPATPAQAGKQGSVYTNVEYGV